MRKNIDGDLCHRLLAEEAKPALAFREDVSLASQIGAAKEKLAELLGMKRIRDNICPLNIDVEEELSGEGYRGIRFTFDSETGATVPAYLLVPTDGEGPFPVVICLQGHTGGFHHSIGEIKSEKDAAFQPRACHAHQALERGFAALAIEQRAMGERQSPLYPNPTVHACAISALTALNLGRTTIGERVFDVSRSIDALEEMADPRLDLSRIMLVGHSGGGTATYYASCLEERIGLSAPAGGFCSYSDSIMSIHHCVCNYIPDIVNWFEMGDLSMLVAPRSLVILTGEYDGIFPIEGVRAEFDRVKRIYKAAGAPGACSLAVSKEHHVFSTEVFWDAITKEAKRLGWF